MGAERGGREACRRGRAVAGAGISTCCGKHNTARVVENTTQHMLWKTQHDKKETQDISKKLSSILKINK